MIIKNEIPIFEYDDSSLEVITPNHGNEDLKLPEKCLFAFLGDVVHNYAKEHDAEIANEYITVSHNVNVYILHEEEEDICLVQPTIGAPAATGLMDFLVNCGCKKVIAVGNMLNCIPKRFWSIGEIDHYMGFVFATGELLGYG